MDWWRIWQRYQLWIGLIPACAMILASLIYYLDYSEKFGTYMTLGTGDFGDYRYVAEKFWGIPHKLEQYHRDFSGGWGYYLDHVPFRGVLPGSMFVLVVGLTQWLAPHMAEQETTMTWIFVTVLQAIFCLSYLIFYLASARRFGAVAGLLLLYPLLLTPTLWYMTEDIHIGEPILRSLFLLMAATLISYYDQPQGLFRMAVICLVLLLLCGLCKPQWILLAAGMFVVFFLLAQYSPLTSKQQSVLLLLLLCIPASIWAVNYYGWGVSSLTPGTGLHANYKTQNRYMAYLCGNYLEDFQMFCDRKTANSWWKIYLEKDVPPAAFITLDRESMGYFLQRPMGMWHDLVNGLQRAQNFLGIPWLSKASAYVTWLGLLLGLFRRETFLLAAYGIGLWIIPAIGNMFSAFDARYYHVMSGIPLVMALLIIYHYAKDENIRLWLKKRFSF